MINQLSKRAHLICSALIILSLMTTVTQGEKIDFSNRIEASGTTCFLENMSETTQGKPSQPQSRVSQQ